jgi:dephospho-CoA kinase
MIIGITGTNGAGKGTVVEYLVQKKGFSHFSARDFLVEEIRKRGMPENRSSTREVGGDLRKKFGPSYIAEQLYTQALEKGGDAILESIRTIGETEFLKSKGAFIGAVDADRKIRYERVEKRGSITDHLSFEDFCIQEDREMSSTEKWDMNVFCVMDMADFKLVNNGTLEELHAQIDALPVFS